MDKSIFNFKIMYKDGTVIDLHEDKNLWVSSFRIHSPSTESITETIEDRHGEILLGKRLNGRKISSGYQIESLDYRDFDLYRDELYRLFNPLQEFYIIRDLQPGKRLKVSVASDFDIDYVTLEDGEFNVDFIIHSVFLESFGTTLDKLEFPIEKWQVGQGLILENPEYVHQSNTFRIFNAGDVTVDPRCFPLKIDFKGASSNLVIKNIITGDTWAFTGDTGVNDTLTLDGIRSLKNGVSIFGQTNKKLISIKEGWNDFEITGATDFLISFDFRFYYY